MAGNLRRLHQTVAKQLARAAAGGVQTPPLPPPPPPLLPAAAGGSAAVAVVGGEGLGSLGGGGGVIGDFFPATFVMPDDAELFAQVCRLCCCCLCDGGCMPPMLLPVRWRLHAAFAAACAMAAACRRC